MLGNQLRHLEHIDRPLATKNRFEIGIGVDIALVAWILKIVLFDINPELLYHLGTRHRSGSNHLCQISANLHWLHKSRVHCSCHIFVATIINSIIRYKKYFVKRNKNRPQKLKKVARLCARIIWRDSSYC